ncbi:hypothetical protein F2Q69_00016827 [Brassica cretica]|uniref:Peptidase A1 domain-containing protein n=1 Tax=Brassica cretica TaxID=69181 RepID=A0A8S9QI35_BRACR|nr:hypothetical protein F2Q69_00016827 [Brassica cretica]
MHFSAGADLVLDKNNTYMADGEAICLMIMCSPMTPIAEAALFGNRAQNNFLVGYDRSSLQVSFKPTDCGVTEDKKPRDSTSAASFSQFNINPMTPVAEAALFGNRAQNNFLVGYDRSSLQVSFKPTDCGVTEDKKPRDSTSAASFSQFNINSHNDFPCETILNPISSLCYHKSRPHNAPHNLNLPSRFFATYHFPNNKLNIYCKLDLLTFLNRTLKHTTVL